MAYRHFHFCVSPSSSLVCLPGLSTELHVQLSPHLNRVKASKANRQKPWAAAARWKMVAQLSNAVCTLKQHCMCGEAECMPAASVTPYPSFPALSEPEAQQFSYNGWPVSLRGPVSSLPSGHRSQLGGVTKAWWPALYQLSHLPSPDLWTSERVLASGSVPPVSNNAKAVIIFQEWASSSRSCGRLTRNTVVQTMFHVQSRGLLVTTQALRMPAL